MITQRTSCRARRVRAFTLVEVLLVVVIMGVMLSSVIVSLRGRADQRQLEESVKGLAATIRYARQEAAARREPHRLVFTDDLLSYRVEWFNALTQQYEPSRGMAGIFRPLGPGVTVSDFGADVRASPTDPANLAFSPDGSGYHGTLTLAAPDRVSKKIEVLAGSTQVNVVQ